MNYKVANNFEFLDALELHNLYWNKNKTLSQWKQEHRNGTIFTVAKDITKTVGSQAFIPYTLIFNNEEMLTGKSESSLIDQSYRGKGIFKQLYEFGISQCVTNGFECIWGFTQAKKVWQKLGFNVYENCLYSAIYIKKPQTTKQSLAKLYSKISGFKKYFVKQKWDFPHETTEIYCKDNHNPLHISEHIITYKGNIKNSSNRKMLKLLSNHGFIIRKSKSAFVLKNLLSYYDEQLENIENWNVNGL